MIEAATQPLLIQLKPWLFGGGELSGPFRFLDHNAFSISQDGDHPSGASSPFSSDSVTLITNTRRSLEIIHRHFPHHPLFTMTNIPEITLEWRDFVLSSSQCGRGAVDDYARNMRLRVQQFQHQHHTHQLLLHQQSIQKQIKSLEVFEEPAHSFLRSR